MMWKLFAIEAITILVVGPFETIGDYVFHKW